MEFAHDLSTHFSHDIITLGELQELVSLEQFKNLHLIVLLLTSLN